ncbi:hypothetical protein LJB96_02280 [Methanobrevibacter sp. OttesenSCG-928-K11]|nr:hypothetical protein [Methanobrevibacter sp. OttesenSCG-928-K11]MDL2270572.1 hypothetical protein [Methanobrevibacter sp. OttesenSCG-928-I08]
MDILKTLKEINWKGLIIGAALCTFLASFGFMEGYDILIPFASVGLLYIGYTAKNLIMGCILGAIGAIPLALVSLSGALGPITSESMISLIFISCIIVGVITGFVGALFNKNRKKAIEKKEKQEKIGKNKNKKD